MLYWERVKKLSIGTIIFDLGGVMVWTRWPRLTEPLAELTGTTPDEVMKRIRTGNAYFPHMRGELDFSGFHKRLTDDLGVELTPDELLELWNSILEPNEAINPIVKQLKGRYRLAIGSNTDGAHFNRGQEIQPATLEFDDVLVSYELGVCKPDPEFFRRGLAKLGVEAEECLFIDDLEDNIEAARSLGIAGIRFESAEQLEQELMGMGIL